MRHFAFGVLLLLSTSFASGQGELLVFTGNVDRIPYVEFQVVNPDPSGVPLNVQQIGVEYHVMDMGYGFYPIDLRIFFPLAPTDTRNLNNCVKWFKRVQKHELALNLNHHPGQWDGTKSPWPYLQITFAKDSKQIHTWTLDGQEVWLWDAKDVQCWEVMDWRAPYFSNQ